MSDEQKRLATQFQDFETAKAFLRKADDSGRTLYDHITSVILDVVKERPENALEAFESISVRVKNGITDPTAYKERPPIPVESEEHKLLSENIKTTLNLINPPQDEDDIPEPVLIPDLVSESDVLEWGGVQLGKEDVYKLYLSVQKFATDNGVSEVRFFGKIFGTEADYYIIEVRPSEYPESNDESPQLEQWGSGLNEFVYYASNSVSGPWNELPLVRPEWISIARDVRRFFTGNLNAPVLGFPRFPGNEAAYLRTQIARIMSSTWVAPKGFYAPDADATEDLAGVNPDPSYAPHPVLDLLAPENWEHVKPYILKQGRITAYVEQNLDDEDEQAEEHQEEQEQPLPRLTTIADDDHGFGTIAIDSENSGSWSFSVQPGEANPYAAVVAKSLAWPGAVTVAKDRQVVSVYVGYGVKYLVGPYTPPPPPQIQQEFLAEYNPASGEPYPLAEQEDPEPPKDLAEDEDGEQEEEEEFLEEDQ